MVGVFLALFAAGFVVSGVLLSAWNDKKRREQKAVEGRSVFLDPSLLDLAGDDTKFAHRSTVDRIERWAHIGRLCELRSDFNYESVLKARRGEISLVSLSAIERAIYDAACGGEAKNAR